MFESRWLAWIAIFLGTALIPASCATPGSGDEGSGASLNWSTSSQGGGAGNDQPSATTSQGGAGDGGSGAQNGGSGGISNGGQGGAGDGGGGGAISGSAALIATGNSNTLLGAFSGGGGGWKVSLVAEASNDRAAVTFTSGGTALGALRRNGDDQLRYLSWSANSWSAFADIGASITTRAAPSLAAAGGDGHIVFHGVANYMHYYGRYQASAWSPSNEAVAPTAQAQSFGPSAAVIAALNNEVVIAFAGDSDELLYVQSRAAGMWQAATAITDSKVALSPALVAIDGGTTLLLVYVDKDNKKLMWSTRVGSTWSTPIKIDDAIVSDETPQLAALSGSDALLAYRGQDGMAYTVRFNPNNDPAWGAVGGIANPNIAIASAPAIATGIGNATAELAYIDAPGSAAYHTRLIAAGWSTPVLVGSTSLARVAIATTP